MLLNEPSNLHLCQGSTFVGQFFVAYGARASLEDLLLSKVLHHPHHKRCQNCHSKAPPEKTTIYTFGRGDRDQHANGQHIWLGIKGVCI